jgi:hypothetical protein
MVKKCPLIWFPSYLNTGGEVLDSLSLGVLDTCLRSLKCLQ